MDMISPRNPLYCVGGTTTLDTTMVGLVRLMPPSAVESSLNVSVPVTATEPPGPAVAPVTSIEQTIWPDPMSIPGLPSHGVFEVMFVSGEV